ncbi:MAG: LytTR family DNA-binding domain-containing protein [Bacteroidota bacterium]
MTITSNEIILVGSKLNEVRIGFNQVYYFKSDGNYTHLYTENGRFTELISIKSLLTRLPAHPFTRIHKSYVVNKNKVSDFTLNTVNLGKYEIPVGKTFNSELNSFFANAG